MDTRQTSWPNSLILGGGFPSSSPQSCVQSRQQRRECTTDHSPTSSRDFVEDQAMVEAMNRGEEEAFVQLTDRFHSAMIRVALTFVSDRPIAEAVVQDTWIEVLNGLHQWEGRSSLKAWIFCRLTNQAKTKSARGQHDASFSEKGRDSQEIYATMSDNQASYPDEIFQRLRMVMDKLPAFSRQVIVLRDVEGFTSGEVCQMLSVSTTQQRDALHHARQTLQHALDEHPNLYMNSSQS